jgi:hypothetical protein
VDGVEEVEGETIESKSIPVRYVHQVPFLRLHRAHVQQLAKSSFLVKMFAKFCALCFIFQKKQKYLRNISPFRYSAVSRNLS